MCSHGCTKICKHWIQFSYASSPEICWFRSFVNTVTPFGSICFFCTWSRDSKGIFWITGFQSFRFWPTSNCDCPRFWHSLSVLSRTRTGVCTSAVAAFSTIAAFSLCKVAIFAMENVKSTTSNTKSMPAALQLKCVFGCASQCFAAFHLVHFPHKSIGYSSRLFLFPVLLICLFWMLFLHPFKQQKFYGSNRPIRNRGD